MKYLLEYQVENINGFQQRRTNYDKGFSDFSTIHKMNMEKLANPFKLESISMLAMSRQKIGDPAPLSSPNVQYFSICVAADCAPG